LKCKFTPSINYWSGKNDDFVYAPAPNRQYGIVKNYKYPTLTANNHLKGTQMKNLAVVWADVSVEYHADFVTYAHRYVVGYDSVGEMPYPAHSCFAWWVFMMFAWQKSDPTHVDLATLTLADIVALDAEVRTLSRAIEALFLPMVDVYDDLTSDIDSL
jgi:hypothetical protein